MTTDNTKLMYEKKLKLVECLCIAIVNISYIISFNTITLQNRYYYYLHFIDKKLELPRGFICNCHND